MQIFGIRHFSPMGAYHLVNFLNDKKPKLVLIEGPSDFNEFIPEITKSKVKLPIAIMAFTSSLPIETLVYPMAEYCPEYQAILWAYENKCECRFIDLPTNVFLGIKTKVSKEDIEENKKTFNVYEKLDKLSYYGDYQNFWDYTIEYTNTYDDYLKGVNTFSANLRELVEGTEKDYPEIIVRESYMKRQIKDAIDSGINEDEIVVITGAYHINGLLDNIYMTDDEINLLPFEETKKTLMPYSYYRISSISGYGAGNKAPAYYELIWKNRHNLDNLASTYLSRLAREYRKNGNILSSAHIIEATILSKNLAKLNGFNIPCLEDLKDSATTCIGEGSSASLALAFASVEIGKKIGNLPFGTSRTSIQDDFYKNLEDLKLEKYRTNSYEELKLDLREKISVKSENLAFIDLERSFFLHRLRVLNVDFCIIKNSSQQNATWAEYWDLRWTPECEIRIIENCLNGDTILQAAALVIKEKLNKDIEIVEISNILNDAFLCGIPECIKYSLDLLQEISLDSISLVPISKTIKNIANILTFGDIRKFDLEPLKPIVEQLFLKACLILENECICNNTVCNKIIEAISILNEAYVTLNFLDRDLFIKFIENIAYKDFYNSKISGYCTSLLIEKGIISNEELERVIEFRMSKSIPADLCALWFEGISMQNRYSLILRLNLWKKLDEYIQQLDYEEFKRALVFLRRTFVDFSSKEKDNIAENLGEIWGLNKQNVSEVLNQTLSNSESTIIQNLDEFDFDDI